MRGTTHEHFGTGRNAPAGHGFAQYLNGKRSGFGEPAAEPISAPSYSWPNIVIGRKIDMTETGHPWKEFHKKLGDRTHQFGRVLPLSSWMLTYYTASQMNDMLSDRYSRVTQRADDGDRRVMARGVVREINRLIKVSRGKKIESDAKLFESQLLWARKDDPDNLELVEADRDASHAREDSIKDLWLPSRYEAGRQEGYGPFGFGIELPDLDGRLVEEVSELDISIRRSTGLDTRGIARHRLFVVQTLDTKPLPAGRIANFDFPGFPMSMPLKAPAAYME